MESQLLSTTETQLSSATEPQLAIPADILLEPNPSQLHVPTPLVWGGVFLCFLYSLPLCASLQPQSQFLKKHWFSFHSHLIHQMPYDFACHSD